MHLFWCYISILFNKKFSRLNTFLFTFAYKECVPFLQAALSLIFTQLQTFTSGSLPREPLFSCVYFRPISSSTGAVRDVNTLLKGTLAVVTDEEEGVSRSFFVPGGVGIQICNLLYPV